MRQAVTAMLVAVLAGAMAGCGPVETTTGVNCGTYEFPSAMWKHSAGGGDRSDATTKRRRIAVDAILHCDLLRDLDEKEVTRMLGRHSSEPETPNDWTFTIGPGRGPFSVDDEFLRVLFRGGQVVDVSISDG